MYLYFKNPLHLIIAALIAQVHVGDEVGGHEGARHGVLVTVHAGSGNLAHPELVLIKL